MQTFNSEVIFFCLIIHIDYWIPVFFIIKENNFFIISTSPDGSDKPEELPQLKKKVLIIGNEERGIRKKLMENSDFNIKLEKYGKTSSLNAAVSAALFIYELKKRG